MSKKPQTVTTRPLNRYVIYSIVFWILMFHIEFLEKYFFAYFFPLSLSLLYVTITKKFDPIIIALGIAIFAINTVANPGVTGSFLSTLFPVAYLFLSIVGFYSIINFGRYHFLDFKRAIHLSIIIILTIGSLEHIGYLGDAIKRYQEWNFQGYYTNIARDLDIYGHSRVVAFSREPSHFAFTISILSTSALLLSSNVSSVAITIVAVLLSIYICPSPIYITYFFFLALFTRIHLLHSHTFLMTLMFASLILYLFGPELLSVRMHSIISQQDASSIIRIWAPLKLLWSWDPVPIFGFGLGQEIHYASKIRSIYSEIGVPWGALELRYNDPLHNAFVETVLQLGYIGALIIVGLMSYWVKKLNIMISVFWIGFIVIFGTIGGISTFRGWGALAIILVSYEFASLRRNKKVF
jgi:hypothetical protein